MSVVADLIVPNAACRCYLVNPSSFSAANMMTTAHTTTIGHRYRRESGGRDQLCERHLPPLNEDGQTALHGLCQHAHTTVEQVQDFLQQYQLGARVVDVYRRTALFYALKRACSTAVVKAVFQAFPAALMIQDFCGESGIHLLYHPSKDPGILQAVLQEHPALALHRSQSFADRILLDKVCDPWASATTLDYADATSTSLLSSSSSSSSSTTTSPSSSSPSPVRDGIAWSKLVLTIEAAYRSRFGRASFDSKQPPVLHAALYLQLPPALICQLVDMYPEQARQPMTNCLYAAGGAGNDRGQSVGVYDDDDRKMLPLHHVVQSALWARQKAGGWLLRSLASAFPEAARKTYRGQWPLHLALSNGFSWCSGVRELVGAYPGALLLVDPVSQLCPLFQAAVSDKADLTTVLELFRHRPYLVLSNA